MKTKSLLLLWMMLVAVCTAQAVTVPQDYNQFFAATAVSTDGTKLERATVNSTDCWYSASSVRSGSNSAIGTNTLSFANYVDNKLGKEILATSISGTDTTARRNSVFRFVGSAAIGQSYTSYMSFLLNVTQASNLIYKDIFSFDRAYGLTLRGKVRIRKSGTGYVLACGTDTFTTKISPPSSVLSFNTTHLIVLKHVITKKSGGAGGATADGTATTTLFIDPTPGAAEPTSALTLNSINIALMDQIQSIVVVQNNGVAYKMAGLRFSNNWADVCKGAGNNFSFNANTNISALSTLSTSSDITVSGTNTEFNANAAKSIAKLTMGAGTKLNVSSAGLEAADVILKASKTEAPSVTVTNGMTISGNLSLHKTIDNSKWYFVSFPSNVAISAITKISGTDALAYGTNWIIKYYDGQSRTENLGVSSNWKEMASDGTLLANKGYIIRMSNGTSGDYELSFPLNKALLESAETERTVAVSPYGEGTVDANHVGWNLVGVPYMSNFAGSGIGAAYLTFHNGTTYTQSAKADVASIQPYQAFFIQASAAGTGSNLSFATTSRQAMPSAVARVEKPRIAINMTNAGGEDKTTLMLDDAQSVHYVINQDLEKWLTTGTDFPQIYSVLNDVKYAYNGLPVNDVNRLALGVYNKNEGLATIHATASGLQDISGLLLTDKVTNQTTNLLVDDYSYTATAGTDESRFELSIQKIATGHATTPSNKAVYVLKDTKLSISNIQGNNSLVSVFDCQGKLLVKTSFSGDSFETTVPKASLLIVKLLSGAHVYTTKVINQK